MIRKSSSTALLLSFLMILSVLGSGVAFAQDNPSGIDDSQVFEVSNDGQIEGWERAAFTLRTDDTNAATKITPPDTVLGERISGTPSPDTSNGGDSGDAQTLIQDFGERNSLGIHDTGSIRVVIDQGFAQSTALDGQSGVDIIAARLTPQPDKGTPDTSSEAFDLFSSVQNANENASFTMLDKDVQLNGGTYDQSHSFLNPGNYVIFAAVNDNSGEKGFQVTNDEISVDGDAVIIGMDQLSVQDAPATMTSEPTDASPGEDLEFGIDTSGPFSGSDVTHAVAVYHADTFKNSKFDVVVNENNFGNSFSASDDMQLEHSISEVNGVADVEPGTTVNGYDLSDGKVSRPVTATSVVDFLADEAGTNDPSTHKIETGGASDSDFETIDASVTVVNSKSAASTVTVETLNDFTEGEYRYVVLSTLDNDEQNMSTSTGTISLTSGTTSTPTPTETPSDGDDDDDSSSGSSGSSGGGAPAPSAEFDITNATINKTVINSSETVAVNVTVANDGDADGEFEADLTLGGISLTEETVDIAEGTNETITLLHTFNRSGAFTLKINDDFEVGTILVDEDPAEVSQTEARDLVDEEPDEPGLRVGFRNVSVSNITFSNESATGNVSVDDLTRVPHDISQPGGEVVQTSRITVPETQRNESATVQLRVNGTRLRNLNASAEDLVISRYNETAEKWEDLNTSVTASSNESVLLEAETPGFSLFAVTVPQEEETTPTPTATPTDLTPTPTDLTPTPTETDTTDDITTDTPDDTPTETDSETLPGFGAVVALIALLAAALLAMRRQ
jgi:PGF-pre-PGF domain-containing protein/PGF-CTERM protein